MSLPRDFRLVDPLPIGDAELVASNIVGSLPVKSATPVDYDTWDATDTYAANDVVCWVYTPSSFVPGTSTAPRFGLFTSLISGSLNYEPEKSLALTYWSELDRAAVYNAGTSYSIGNEVYRESGGVADIYVSLTNANVGNTPESSPSDWATQYTTATTWATGTTYTVSNQVGKSSGGTGYIFASQVSGNIGHDPLAVGTLPGAAFWTKTRDVPAWSAATTYGAGAIVGRIDGATGGIYQSLQAGNLNKDPNSEPTWWAQAEENSYKEWDGATTYAAGALVCVFILNKLAYVYRSLAGTNLNHAPGSSPTWWEFVGEAYAEWDSAETYAAGEVVQDARTHHDYESVQGTNTAHDPTTDDGTWWLDLGATNRWRMFDESNGSQSERGNVLDNTLRFASPADTLALLEVDADEVQVIIPDANYDETFDLFDRPGESSWYTYFLAPTINRRSVLVTGVYIPAGADIQYIASRPGQTVKMGNVLVGRAVALGGVLNEAKIGIDDFSRAEENEFGDLQIVPRAWRRKAELTLAVEPLYSDSVVEALAARRATATLYIASDTYSSLLIYGFARSWSGEMKYPTIHHFPIELIALT